MQTPYEEAAGASLFGDISRKPLSGGQVQKGKEKKEPTQKNSNMQIFATICKQKHVVSHGRRRSQKKDQDDRPYSSPFILFSLLASPWAEDSTWQYVT